MMKYKTKIDWWFWCISILLLGFGAGMLAYKPMRTTGVIWIAIVGVVLILCIIDTKYIFEDEALIVKFSLFEKYIIPYKAIMNITKVHYLINIEALGYLLIELR